MKNSPLVINLIFFYFIFSMLSSAIFFPAMFIVSKFDFNPNSIIRLIAILLLIVWVFSLLFMTYASAKSSTYNGKDAVEAIKDAAMEYRVLVSLAFPFLAPNINSEKEL